MEEHQKRVVTEKANLDRMIEALEVFIAGVKFKQVEYPEQVRMRQQRHIMIEYSDILGERIANF